MSKNKKYEIKTDNSVVYYINLDSRVDRKNLIEEELKKLFKNFNRVSAEDGNKLGLSEKIAGSVGCAYSHIKALELGLINGAENIFIFEDDFQLEINTCLAKNMLDKITKSDFNLVLLSYHMPVVRLYDIKNYLANITNGQTTCAYVIKRKMAKELINIFKKSIEELIKTELIYEYSIDQTWKALQTPANKTYGTIPRLGKQRSDYSNISNQNVDYGGTCFMGILACNKYKDRRLLQNLKGCPFQYKYFIGKPNISSPIVKGDIVYLPCGDNYEDLSDKSYEMFKWILNNNEQVDYIFKTDDDIKFDFEKLMMLYSEILLSRLDYCGNATNIEPYDSIYHYDKCFDKGLNVPLKLESAKYCSGGGYFLSKKSVKIVLDNMKKSKTPFEDYSIGKTLNNNGIYPVGINIKDNACFW